MRQSLLDHYYYYYCYYELQSANAIMTINTVRDMSVRSVRYSESKQLLMMQSIPHNHSCMYGCRHNWVTGWDTLTNNWRLSTYDDRFITRFYSLLFTANWKRRCSLELSLLSQPYSGILKCCPSVFSVVLPLFVSLLLLQLGTSVQVDYQLTVQQPVILFKHTVARH